MGVVHAHVVDRHDHLRLARLDGPGLVGVDVTSFRPLVPAARIVVVPLLCEPRVVEERRFGQTARLGNELHFLDAFQGGEGGPGLGQRQGGVEGDVVPQVQACGAVPCLPFAGRREGAGHRAGAEGRQIRSGGFRGRRVVFELDPDVPGQCTDGTVGRRRRGLRVRAGGRLLHACGSEQEQGQTEKGSELHSVISGGLPETKINGQGGPCPFISMMQRITEAARSGRDRPAGSGTWHLRRTSCSSSR